MSYLYVWKARQLSPPEAEERFQHILARQTELHRQALGHSFTWRSHRVGDILIGQIQLLSNIDDWTEWAQNGDSGIAWSGICEDYLGQPMNDEQIRHIVSTVHTTPEQLVSWNGRFALSTWSMDDVRLTTGATESPSLWYTEGPEGWAAGSRSAPLLGMVGRKPTLDHHAASLYIAFGYLIGASALFEHVSRLPARRQVVFTNAGTPSVRKYASIADYLEESPALSWDDAVGRCSQRLLTRVKHQLCHTPSPKLLLTGGRDSRCIAAATSQQDFAGPTQTTGNTQSAEVQIASRVAHTLHMQHEVIPLSPGYSPMRAVSLDAAKLWTEMSEGMDVLLQAVSFQGFFQRQLPFPPIRHQLLHGLGGEITRGFYYANASNHDLLLHVQLKKAGAAIAKKVPLGLTLRHSLDPLLMDVIEKTNDEINCDYVTLAQWLDAFYWLNRCLQWGSDSLSVREPLYWHWTPLLDRTFIRTGWRLSPSDKVSNRFVEAVTHTLAADLREVPYDHSSSTLRMRGKQMAKQVLGFIDRYSHGLLRGITFKPARVPADEYLLRFWDEVFFNRANHAWPDLVKESVIRQLLERNPTIEVLWNIATVEVFAQTHCL